MFHYDYVPIEGSSEFRRQTENLAAAGWEVFSVLRDGDTGWLLFVRKAMQQPSKGSDE
jgi:hypothetical protein